MRELASITIHTKLVYMKKFAWPITYSSALRKPFTYHTDDKHIKAKNAKHVSN